MSSKTLQPGDPVIIATPLSRYNQQRGIILGTVTSQPLDGSTINGYIVSIPTLTGTEKQLFLKEELSS